MSSLELKDLLIERGGRRVLEIPSLEFKPGLHVIRGPNGAGKSTLLQAIAGLLPFSRGRIQSGELVHRGSCPGPLAYRRVQSLVLQEPLLLRARVLDELVMVLAWHGFPVGQRRARGLELLTSLDLESLSSSRTDTLSVGERRMVGFARALVSGPQILLLDEVTAGIGAARIPRVVDAVGRVVSEGGIVLSSTHEASHLQPLPATEWYVDHGGIGPGISSAR